MVAVVGNLIIDDEHLLAAESFGKPQGDKDAGVKELQDCEGAALLRRYGYLHGA